jgi:hypothetical protein
MIQPILSNELEMLRHCWHQWTKVVECYALNRALWRVDEHEYRQLHRRLLQSCRKLTGQADADQARFFESIEDLAKPWLSARTLCRTDGKMLADLLEMCRRAESRLQGPKTARRWKRWLWIAALLAAGASLALLAPTLERFALLAVDWVSDPTDGLRQFLFAPTAVQTLLLASTGAALAAIYIAYRMRRL